MKKANDLPMLPKPVDPAKDWLIHQTDRKAGVFQTGRPDEIALDNGLVRRTFRLAPNAATVGLDNLVTSEALLRGVKPEATLTIDGVEYEVGGLKGQPNYAYLAPEWLDDLEANPAAFTFDGFEVGPIEERLSWMRKRRHAPGVQWPPPGVALHMHYRFPETPARDLSGTALESAEGRTSIFVEPFDAFGDPWTEHRSAAHERSSFQNEGKVGEIYAPANTAVFAERPLPPGVRLVETTIFAGTDNSSSWGPGVALVWPERTVKFHLRPGGNHYDQGVAMLGLFDGERENPFAGGRQKLDVSVPWSLRIRIEDDALCCEARTPDTPWQLVETIELDKPLGDPTALRVGKMDARGDGEDHGAPGDLVRLQIESVAAWGVLDEEALGRLDRKRQEARGIRVTVHYELYDDVPAMSKWVSVENGTPAKIVVNRFRSEILAAVEQVSWVESRGLATPPPNIYAETDYAFGGMTAQVSNRFAVHLVSDPDYSTQVNYLREQPCLLEIGPEIGPEQDVEPGDRFDTFRAFLMPWDSSDRQRRALAIGRYYRTIAPWVTENPLMMHVRFADWETVKAAIDQCADVGFELVILTFGSGFDIEDESPENLEKMAEYVKYAHSRGVEIGGYTLLSSRRVQPDSDNCHNPATGQPGGQTHGFCPASASAWGREYFRKLYQFFEKTGFDNLEHDGPYPGDLDAKARPPYQKGLRDSQWVQFKMSANFYSWLRGRGVYINAPDYYFLVGTSSIAMGYREVNWSLPRDQQVIHTRQNIYDGTWDKTPTMGWMFVPLTEYHGGGAAATIEPLDEHLDHYDRMLTSNLAHGAQACYRGPRLYDTERTRELVKKRVAWFKEYRDILESDLVHGRRADGRDLDWMLHANPRLEHKGMLVVFNPLTEEARRTLLIDLYYTGLTGSAKVRHEGGNPQTVEMDKRCRISLDVRVAPRGMTWYVIE